MIAFPGFCERCPGFCKRREIQNLTMASKKLLVLLMTVSLVTAHPRPQDEDEDSKGWIVLVYLAQL